MRRKKREDGDEQIVQYLLWVSDLQEKILWNSGGCSVVEHHRLFGYTDLFCNKLDGGAASAVPEPFPGAGTEAVEYPDLDNRLYQ